MTDRLKHRVVDYLIAAVWLINGLFCKILNMVPRHQEIVSNILGHSYAGEITIVIGVAEVMMGIWILAGIWKRLNAVMQIVIIATMNILEFILVPDLLLWGKLNAFFALAFCLLIYYNQFHLKKTLALKP